MTVERKLLLACILTGALLALAAAVTLRNHHQLRAMHTAVQDVHEADLQLQRALGLAVDTETGVRGFLLTGGDEFLTPYREAEAQIAEAVADLRQSVEKAGAQGVEFGRLETAINRVMERMRAVLGAAQGQGVEAARAMVATAEGKAIMDQLREQVGAIRARQEALLQKRREQSDAQHRAALGVTIALIGLIMLTLGAAYFTVRFHLVERRNAEAERDRFFTLSLDMMGVLDKEGHLTRVNPAWTQTLGWSEEELRSKPLLDFVVPEDRQATQQVLARIAAGEPVAAFENRYLCKDGSTRVLSWRSAAHADGLIYATARDVTERLVKEEALRTSEQYNRSIVESTGDYLAVLDLDGRVVDVPGKVEGEGLSIERGVEWQSLWVEGAVASARLAIEAARKGGVGHFHGLSGQLTSEPKWWDVTITAIRETNGEVSRMLAVARDITEHRHAEQKIEEARQNADRANTAKSEFLSRMSHELRTPMNAILGFAQVIEMGNPPDAMKVPLTHIMKAGRHLLELINEVLDIARIEAGRMTISLEPVPLGEVIGECVALMRPFAAERNVTIEADVPIDDPQHVYADRQRLKQALLNLLSNAVKFNKPEGLVRVKAGPIVWGDGTSEAGEGRIGLSISDTGAGMSDSEITLLFEPFERLNADSRGIEGTGLGLALTKRLITLMGGTISVESARNRGTTFSIELRSADAPRSQTRAEIKQPEVTAALNGRSILYIEDNLSNFQLIEHIIGKYQDVSLLAAMHGRSGIEMAHQHRPDLILLDLHLPDVLGDEVLRRLRADPATQRTPVIILTADATSGQEKRLMELGANAYLTKPFDVPRLLECMDKLLEGAARKPQTDLP